MASLKLTRKERDELAELAAEFMNVVEITDSSRHHAVCTILAVEGAKIEWKFIFVQGEYALMKTRLGDGVLTYQSNKVFRLAWLRCKEAVAAVIEVHKKRNERLQANPSPRKLRERAARINRARQKDLPFEMHTHHRPRRNRFQ